MRKGYTLIELIITLAILALIFSIGYGSLKIYQKMREDIEIEGFLYEVEDSFSFAKEYCKNKGVNGTIYLEEYEDKIRVVFKDNYNFIREKQLSKVLELVKVNGEKLPKVITKNVNKKGDISDYENIKLKDKSNSNYVIKTTPITNMIEVRKI